MNANLKRILVLLLLTSPCVIAAPFTYEFIDKPAYNSNSTIYGSSLVYDFTFDNGSSSNINQKYTIRNLTAVTITAIGGTFKQQYNQACSYIFAVSGNAMILNTDSSGKKGTFFPVSKTTIPGQTNRNTLFTASSNYSDGVYGNWFELSVDLNNFANVQIQQSLNDQGITQMYGPATSSPAILKFVPTSSNSNCS
ncbi:MAG: hypothetical protein D0528_09750 [Methylococcales bacterium]|nr:MAG: hypothetical protein D0528_09750 [Methylococcales bacterium]